MGQETTKDTISRVLYDMLQKEGVEVRHLDENDLIASGMNSIIFIKLVVELEAEFSIIFDGESLDYSRFHSLDSLAEYIENIRC